jgi:hypothetical protein
MFELTINKYKYGYNNPIKANKAIEILSDWVSRTQRANITIVYENKKYQFSSTQKALDFVIPYKQDKPVRDLSKLNESILDYDYPVYGGYLYVVNDKVYSCDYYRDGLTVGRLALLLSKERNLPVEEITIKNCDLAGRGFYD